MPFMENCNKQRCVGIPSVKWKPIVLGSFRYKAPIAAVVQTTKASVIRAWSESA